MKKGLEVTKTHKCKSVPSLHLADFSLTHYVESNVGYYPCNYKHGLEARTLGGKYHPGLKVAEPCLYDENNLTDTSSSDTHCPSPTKQINCYVDDQCLSENDSCTTPVYPEKSHSQPLCKTTYSMEMEGYYKVDWSAAGEEYTDADSSSELKEDCEDNSEANRSLENSWNKNMNGDSNQKINSNLKISSRRKENDDDLSKDPEICDNECCKKVSSSSQNYLLDQSDVFSQVELLENETFPKIGSTDISYIETEDLGFCSSRKSSESSLFSQKSDESTSNIKNIALESIELGDNENQNIVTVQRKNSFTDLAQNTLLQMLEHHLPCKEQSKTLVEEMFETREPTDKCDNHLDSNEEETEKEATAFWENVNSSQTSLKVTNKTQQDNTSYLSEVPDADCANESNKLLSNKLPLVLDKITESIIEESSTKPTNSILNSTSSDEEKKLKNLQNISEFHSKDALESIDKLCQIDPSQSQSSSNSSKLRPQSAGAPLKIISSTIEPNSIFCLRPHSAGEGHVLAWNAACESPGLHSKSNSKASNQELRSEECFSFNSIASPSLTSERLDADSPSWSTDSINKYRDFAKMPKRELLARLVAERRHREELDQLLAQLHDSYDKMLAKYAEAENTIDQLRLGSHFRLEPSPNQPPAHVIPKRLVTPEKDRSKFIKPPSSASGTKDGYCQTDLPSGDSECLMSSIACLLLRANCLLEQVDSLRECVEEGIRMDPEVETQVFNYLWDSLISLQQEVHSYTNVGTSLENLTLEDTKKLLIKIHTLLQNLQPKQNSLVITQHVSPQKKEEENDENEKSISSTEKSLSQQAKAVCSQSPESLPPKLNDVMKKGKSSQHNLSEVDSGCHSSGKSIPSNLGKLSTDDMLAILCQKSTYLSISDVEHIAKSQTSVASINLNTSKEHLERQSSSESECLNVVKALLKVIYKEDSGSRQGPWNSEDHTRSYKSDTTLIQNANSVNIDRCNYTNASIADFPINNELKSEIEAGNERSQETQNLEFLKVENTQIKFSHSSLINTNDDFHKVEDNLIVKKFESSNMKSYSLAGGNDIRIEKCNKSEDNVISAHFRKEKKEVIEENQDFNSDQINNDLSCYNDKKDCDVTLSGSPLNSEVESYEGAKNQDSDRQINEMCALLKNKVHENLLDSDDSVSKSKEIIVMKLLDEVKRRLSEKTFDMESKANSESEDTDFPKASSLEQRENDDSQNVCLSTCRTDATDDLQAKQELLSPDVGDQIHPVVQFRGNCRNAGSQLLMTSPEQTTENSTDNFTELDFICYPAPNSVSCIPVSNLIDQPSSTAFGYMTEDNEFNQAQNASDQLMLQKLNEQIQQLREALFLKNSKARETANLCSQSCQTDNEKASSNPHLHICNNCGSSFNRKNNQKAASDNWQNIYEGHMHDKSIQSQKTSSLSASRSGTVLHCCGLHHILYSEKPESDSDLFQQKVKNNSEYEISSYKATCPCCQYVLDEENSRPRTAPTETLCYKENEDWNCSENSPRENLQSDFHLSESDLFKSTNCRHHGKIQKFCQFCETLSSSSISEDGQSLKCYETDQFSPVVKINDHLLQNIKGRKNLETTNRSIYSDGKCNSVGGHYGVKFTLHANESDSTKRSEKAEQNTKEIGSYKINDNDTSTNVAHRSADSSESVTQSTSWPPLNNKNKDISFKINDVKISLEEWDYALKSVSKEKLYLPLAESPQLSEDRSWSSHKHLSNNQKKQFPKGYTCREARGFDEDITEIDSERNISPTDNLALFHSKISYPLAPIDDMQIVNCLSPVPISAIQVLSEKLPISQASLYSDKNYLFTSENYVDAAVDSRYSVKTVYQNESDNMCVNNGLIEYPKELDESIGTMATCNSDQMSEDNISHNSQTFVKYIEEITNDKEFGFRRKLSGSLNNLMIIDSVASGTPSVNSDNYPGSDLQLTFQSLETKSIGIQSEINHKDADTQAEAYPVNHEQEIHQVFSSVGIQSETPSKDAFTQLCPSVTDAVTEMSPASQTDSDLTSVSVGVQLDLIQERAATPRSESESTYTGEIAPVRTRTDESTSVSISDRSDEEKSTDHMEESEVAPLSIDLLNTKEKHYCSYKGKWKGGAGGCISKHESAIDHHSCRSCTRLLKKTEAVATTLLMGLQNSRAMEESSEEDLEVRKLQLIHALDLANKMAKRLKRHSMKMLHSLSSESDFHE